MEIEVKCNWCDWAGQEEDLAFGIPADCQEDGETKICPGCGNEGYLMDVLPSSKD